jgi:hypothetical protein
MSEAFFPFPQTVFRPPSTGTPTPASSPLTIGPRMPVIPPLMTAIHPFRPTKPPQNTHASHLPRSQSSSLNTSPPLQSP